MAQQHLVEGRGRQVLPLSPAPRGMERDRVLVPLRVLLPEGVWPPELACRGEPLSG